MSSLISLDFLTIFEKKFPDNIFNRTEFLDVQASSYSLIFMKIKDYFNSNYTH